MLIVQRSCPHTSIYYYNILRFTTSVFLFCLISLSPTFPIRTLHNQSFRRITLFSSESIFVTSVKRKRRLWSVYYLSPSNFDLDFGLQKVPYNYRSNKLQITSKFCLRLRLNSLIFTFMTTYLSSYLHTILFVSFYSHHLVIVGVVLDP